MLDIRPIGIEDYAERCSKPLSELHEKLWVETYAKTHSPGMMVGPVEGQFLKMLAQFTGARRILEIGMFTGYSTLAWAEALPKDGRVVTCEVNAESAEIAKRYFAESPHSQKIEIKLGPALESLKRIWGPFDICFIDADKENYGAYYDACFELVRPRGQSALNDYETATERLTVNVDLMSPGHRLSQGILVERHRCAEPGDAFRDCHL